MGECMCQRRVFANLLVNCNWILCTQYCHHLRYHAVAPISLTQVVDIKTHCKGSVHVHTFFSADMSTCYVQTENKRKTKYVRKWKEKAFGCRFFLLLPLMCWWKGSKRWYDQQVIYNIYKRRSANGWRSHAWHVHFTCIDGEKLALLMVFDRWCVLMCIWTNTISME